MNNLIHPDFQEEKTYEKVKLLANGSEEYTSQQILQEDLDKVGEYIGENKKKTMDSKRSPGMQAVMSFLYAEQRDLTYAVCGRKYMRTAGLNGKNGAASGRSYQLGLALNLQFESKAPVPQRPPMNIAPALASRDS